jgi:hypothetical protein
MLHCGGEYTVYYQYVALSLYWLRSREHADIEVLGPTVLVELWSCHDIDFKLFRPYYNSARYEYEVI